jgi:hypothetical protein
VRSVSRKKKKRSKLWIAGVAVLCVGAIRSSRGYYDQYRSRDGVQVLSPSDSGVDASGQVRAMLAHDSATFVFIVDAKCYECDEHASDYAVFAKWAAEQRVATRWFVVADMDPAAFAEKVGARDAVLGVSSSWQKRFGIRVSPSVLLLDRHGRIRGKWIGWTPRQRDAVATLRSLTD